MKINTQLKFKVDIGILFYFGQVFPISLNVDVDQCLALKGSFHLSDYIVLV